MFVLQGLVDLVWRVPIGVDSLTFIAGHVDEDIDVGREDGFITLGAAIVTVH